MQNVRTSPFSHRIIFTNHVPLAPQDNISLTSNCTRNIFWREICCKYRLRTRDFISTQKNQVSLLSGTITPYELVYIRSLEIWMVNVKRPVTYHHCFNGQNRILVPFVVQRSVLVATKQILFMNCAPRRITQERCNICIICTHWWC